MGVAPLVHGWPPAQQSRAPLTTARAAYDLTLAVARRAYPVRLRATVTYYDP